MRSKIHYSESRLIVLFKVTPKLCEVSEEGIDLGTKFQRGH